MAEFKKQYPKLYCRIAKMLLFTKSGFDKIAKTCKLKVERLPCFHTQPKALEKPKTIYAMVPQNPQIQKAMQKIRDKMLALEAVMSCYNKYNVDIDTSKGLLKTVTSVSGDILMEAYNLSDIKPKTTTEKVL